MLVAIAGLLVVAAVSDVAHRVHAERHLAADKVTYVRWHRAHSERPGWGIKIRYGTPFDVACGALGKKGNRLTCLELRRAQSRATVAGGYRLDRRSPGVRFVRSHCFGAARRLADCPTAAHGKA
ncbi:MAG: hypothetical protein QOF37_2979 [Thermoleophilaceae bacterium]|nr:hypothetical protein [Thermoleophilaceae bacterium]